MSPDFHIVWIFTIDIFHILHVPFLIPGQSPDMMGLQGFSVFRMIWKTLLTFLFQQWHPQPQPQPYPYLFKTQTPVPKFHKNMSVNIWIQNAKVWSNSFMIYSRDDETNNDTGVPQDQWRGEEVGRWIVSTINEGEFEEVKTGALGPYWEIFKAKFEIPDWRICNKLCGGAISLHQRGRWGTEAYLENWLHLEAKIKTVEKPYYRNS